MPSAVLSREPIVVWQTAANAYGALLSTTTSWSAHHSRKIGPTSEEEDGKTIQSVYGPVEGVISLTIGVSQMTNTHTSTETTVTDF